MLSCCVTLHGLIKAFRQGRSKWPFSGNTTQYAVEAVTQCGVGLLSRMPYVNVGALIK